MDFDADILTFRHDFQEASLCFHNLLEKALRNL